MSGSQPPKAGVSHPQVFESELKLWVEQQLKLGKANPSSAVDDDSEILAWQGLNGDAGFRKYFRLSVSSCPLIAVYAPPETENNAAFLAIDKFLFEHGVHVPKIIAYDLAQGYFLLEDLGKTLYLDHLDEDSANGLYGEALLALMQIQQCPLDTSIFPEYDATRLNDEMALFPQWFVTELLGYELSDRERALIERAFEILLVSAEEQPKVIVHRDFHSRNIVYGVSGVPGIVDFQDAVIGPFTYDVVSLLRDCYIQWPPAQVKNWLLAYGNMAFDAGILPPVSQDCLLRWFDLMGLQRHIKVLGIFARLSLRDGKHGYLRDLPLVVEYVRTVVAEYEELKPFRDWFESALMPLVLQQTWAERLNS
ncbi:MAG: phosphotransferase [Agarilytica sp.]